MLQEKQSRKTYPSEVTDEPWTVVAPRLPPAPSSPRGGRPRQVDLRAVLHPMRSRHRSGCQGEMWPHDLLPTSPVYASCAPWRADGTWTQVVTA
jgi:putative transposase